MNFQVCTKWKIIIDEDLLWKTACAFTWAGKQNMSLERWIRSCATCFEGMSEQAYFIDNELDPLLAEDEHAEDESTGEDEESDKSMQDDDQEYFVLCNEMQRILFDAMLAERLDSTNDADDGIDEMIEGDPEESHANAEAGQVQPYLTTDHLQAWRVTFMQYFI
jgi:hypothetical protein